MKIDKITGWILGLLIAIPSMVCATHNRAGEITYEQIGELTVRAIVTTYTKTSSAAADRDSVDVYWGDGSFSTVLRSNGFGVATANDIKINTYTAEHTYPGRGTYTISMTDPNRVGNILNVNWPNSINVPFYIETTFTLLNGQFQGYNNSVRLLEAPIDFACAGRKFIHNPSAYDSDDDSLVYSLVVPFQAVDMEVPGYIFPNQVSSGVNNNISLDTKTGSFIWDAPQTQGEYNIAIKIDEYRGGQLISSMIRDMQIFVRFCENNPPVVAVEESICVVAGEVLEIPISVDDPDSMQLVQMTVSGGPFELTDGSASIEIAEGYNEPKLNGIFRWITNCNHISQNPYQLVFRGVDNFEDTTGLADIKTLTIKVVGPPPLDVQAESLSDKIKVSWELPYDCEFAREDFFIGFSVWRREGSNQFEIDTCTPGLENKDYEQIIFLTNDNADGRYFGIDTDVERGKTYCYRVLGEFARATTSGNPYNRVQSLPSEEVCTQLSRDLPLLTEVSVVETDSNSGKISISWVKPLAADLDTIKNPGPYRYQLLRSNNGISGAYSPIVEANFIAQNFNSVVDTSYMDTNLNTDNQPYAYRIDFSTSVSPISESILPASSVFLNIDPNDQENNLNWTYDVPWEQLEFRIFEQSDGATNFTLLGSTNNDSFTHKNLINGQNHCYYIEAIGSYGIEKIKDPLVNLSQIRCASPEDNKPPCTGRLSISSICDSESQAREDDVFNVLSWTNPLNDCPEARDLAGYRIYFAQEDSIFQMIQEIKDATLLSFEHKPDIGISGCYYVTAIDDKGNESISSDTICIENCPLYELPNTFTPNLDGHNDLYRPRINRFVQQVEFVVVNRWGQTVFETSDPELNWDGTNQNGSELAEGTYYYSCKILEKINDGNPQTIENLSGYIHLIRSN